MNARVMTEAEYLDFLIHGVIPRWTTTATKSISRRHQRAITRGEAIFDGPAHAALLLQIRSLFDLEASHPRKMKESLTIELIENNIISGIFILEETPNVRWIRGTDRLKTYWDRIFPRLK